MVLRNEKERAAQRSEHRQHKAARQAVVQHRALRLRSAGSDPLLRGTVHAGRILIQYAKETASRSSLFKRLKKVCDFFARLKNATFFVKTSFHEKSRYARQKVRTGHF